MGSHLRMKGLSRRAYARSRGCSDTAVRQAIADGRLKGAVLPDGTIDAAKADDLLAKATLAPPVAPSDLSAARIRKLRATCALLADDVRRDEALAVPRDEAERVTIASSLRVAAFLRRMVDDLVPNVANVAATEANKLVETGVHATLTALAETEVDGGTPSSATAAGTDALGDMNGIELAALKATLEAKMKELELALREGRLVRLQDLSTGMVQRFAATRTKVLAMPHRCAPLLQRVDRQEAKRVLGRAVDEAIEELLGPFVTREQLDVDASSSRLAKQNRWRAS